MNPVAKKNADMVLRQAYERYIYSKRNILSPGTVREYNRALRKDFPTLMNLRLGEITQEKVQIAINEVTPTCSPKTVINMHSLLNSVLKQYCPELKLNTLLPRVEKSEIVIPSQSDIKELYRTAQNTIMELPFLLASQVGLREAEIASLEHKHFDVEKSTLSVQMAAARGESGYKMKGTKSVAGKRILILNELIFDAYYKSAKYKKEILRPHKLFFDKVVGITPNAIGSRWEHIVEKSGISRKVTFHSLRHYFCSQALLNNIPKEYIAKMMGHEDTSMVERVYGHTFEESEIEFGMQMAKLTDNLLE